MKISDKISNKMLLLTAKIAILLKFFSSGVNRKSVKVSLHQSDLLLEINIY